MMSAGSPTEWSDSAALRALCQRAIFSSVATSSCSTDEWALCRFAASTWRPPRTLRRLDHALSSGFCHARSSPRPQSAAAPSAKTTRTVPGLRVADTDAGTPTTVPANHPAPPPGTLASTLHPTCARAGGDARAIARARARGRAGYSGYSATLVGADSMGVR